MGRILYYPLCVLTNSLQIFFFFDKIEHIREILKVYNTITPLPHLGSETTENETKLFSRWRQTYHLCGVKGDSGEYGFCLQPRQLPNTEPKNQADIYLVLLG